VLFAIGTGAFRHLINKPFKHAFEQCLFGGKVIEDPTLRDLCRSCHSIDCQMRSTRLLNNLRGRIEDEGTFTVCGHNAFHLTVQTVQ
jgi:hypothetical protein